MLSQLTIRNYALIRHLEMVPSRELTVITGETGAGKSIMLGAIGLLKVEGILGRGNGRREAARGAIAAALLGLPLMIVTVALSGTWIYARFTLFALPGAIPMKSSPAGTKTFRTDISDQLDYTPQVAFRSPASTLRTV